MKKLKLSLLAVSLIFALSSCETLKDPEVEVGPVYPLSGEWIVRFIKPNPTVASDTSAFTTVSTFNDANNSSSSLWLRKTSTSTSTIVKAFTVKTTCDVAGKSFNIDNGVNTVLASGVSVGTCKITEGKVTIDGWNTNSGHKSDKITFKYEDSRTPGVVYSAEGYRRTGWWEDEP